MAFLGARPPLRANTSHPEMNPLECRVTGVWGEFMKISSLRIVVFLFLAVSSLLGQTESGKFRLHKFEQPIGEESYTITRAADGVELSADFLFTEPRYRSRHL